MPGGEWPALTILGSGTLAPDARHHSAAHHLRLPSASVLLDCGPGTTHGFARHGVAWHDLTHIALSHYHNDHVGDLAAVLFALKHGPPARRTEPLTLLGPQGFTGFLGRLADALGDHVTDPGFELRVVEVGPGRPFDDAAAGFTLSCHPTPHTPESLAYRVEGAWGAVGYTGDTGPSDEVAAFLDGCDVLVAECNSPDQPGAGAPPPEATHLSPTTLARLAEVARPRLLAVVHVSPLHTPDEAARGVSAGYGGVVVAASDGMRVVLGPDGPVVDPTTAAI